MLVSSHRLSWRWRRRRGCLAWGGGGTAGNWCLQAVNWENGPILGGKAMPGSVYAAKRGAGFAGGWWEGERLPGAPLRRGSLLRSSFTGLCPETPGGVLGLKAKNKPGVIFAVPALPSLRSRSAGASVRGEGSRGGPPCWTRHGGPPAAVEGRSCAQGSHTPLGGTVNATATPGWGGTGQTEVVAPLRSGLSFIGASSAAAAELPPVPIPLPAVAGGRGATRDGEHLAAAYWRPRREGSGPGSQHPSCPCGSPAVGDAGSCPCLKHPSALPCARRLPGAAALSEVGALDAGWLLLTCFTCS